MSLFPSKPNRSRPASRYAITFAFLFCVALGCFTPQPPAESAREQPVPGFLRIGISGDYAPFSVWSWPLPEPTHAPSEGQPTTASLLPRPPYGFSVDVARAYADARGAQIEWIKFRWPELQSDLEARRFDIALSGVTVRADRALHGRFSLPLTTSSAVLLLPGDSEIGRRIAAGANARVALNRPEIRIAVNAGGHLESVTRRLFPAAKISPVAANADVLDHLQLQLHGNDRADAVMTDSREAPHWQKRMPSLVASSPLTQDRKAAWFAPKKNDDLVGDFDRWLLEFEADGGLAALRAKAGLPDATTARPIEALWATLDDRLGLMTHVAESKRTLGKPVEDQPREVRVLNAAVAGFEKEAKARGLENISPEAVRRLFRAQIEAAKTIQRNHLARPIPPRPHASGEAEQGAKSDAERAEAQETLDRQIRPALIFLGDRITRLLVAARLDPDLRPAPDALKDALERHGLPEHQVREMNDALEDLLNRGAEQSERSSRSESEEAGKPSSA
ncbi:MAG: transporter substrate-binding domain-containing protein [Myxococcota bacterium]